MNMEKELARPPPLIHQIRNAGVGPGPLLWFYVAREVPTQGPNGVRPNALFLLNPSSPCPQLSAKQEH